MQLRKYLGNNIFWQIMRKKSFGSANNGMKSFGSVGLPEPRIFFFLALLYCILILCEILIPREPAHRPGFEPTPGFGIIYVMVRRRRTRRLGYTSKSLGMMPSAIAVLYMINV